MNLCQRAATIGAASAALFFSSLAQAHGDAQWIADEKHRAVSGELCCGPEDCGPVPDREVERVRDGWLVKGHFVPWGEALPSVDNHYWACTKPGGIRCFFFRQGGSS